MRGFLKKNIIHIEFRTLIIFLRVIPQNGQHILDVRRLWYLQTKHCFIWIIFVFRKHWGICLFDRSSYVR